MNLFKTIRGMAVATVCSLAFQAQADHSFKDVMDGRTNLTEAVTNAAKAKGVPFCDWDNSIQIPYPASANSNIWRQVVLCFSTEAKLNAAHAQLRDRPLQVYGKASTYGLSVEAVADITYERDDVTGVTKKLISFSIQ